MRRALAGETLLAGGTLGGPSVLACIVRVMAELDEPIGIYDAAIAESLRRGSILDFAIAKLHRAQAFVCRGDLAEAEADGREALEACEAWGRRLASGRCWRLRLGSADGAGQLVEAAAALARADLGADPARQQPRAAPSP